MESVKKLKDQISPHVSFPIGTWVDVSTFEELQLKVAELSCLCKQYVLYFRGQGHDYPYKSGETCLYPTIYRGKYTKDKWDELLLASNLLMQKLSAKHPRQYYVSILKRKPMLQWSILQHYEVVPTPLIDVTQSLRVACSFALQDDYPEEYAYIYVVALPYVSHRIHMDSEEYMTVVRLLSIAPPFAKRPYFQDGFLVGEDVIQEKYFSKNELDLSRRLVAKFRIPTNDSNFWNTEKVIPPEILRPENDEMLTICKEIKEELKAYHDTNEPTTKKKNSTHKTMKDKYTYEQIKQATQMMLHHYKIPQITAETGITAFRIRQWRKRWRIMESFLNILSDNYDVLKNISNHTYGVSEDVRQDWIQGIDRNWERLQDLVNPNDIQPILEEVADIVNANHPESQGIDYENIDSAKACIIDQTRGQQQGSCRASKDVGGNADEF